MDIAKPITPCVLTIKWQVNGVYVYDAREIEYHGVGLDFQLVLLEH